ncbi:DUF4386 domain-containing protein [Pontibacter burrus]|uniref:DUF4386 domain-containing protein n=1 Tax=Pontibacter burrus TaxID=2704466 RepID=A0A6B3LYD7_9BACT|nr:DUF4386 domain-containing protein [Pontibacter burrus]NEM98507.1 DUF4386 domain-containing protein [Pontibacter burrus]
MKSSGTKKDAVITGVFFIVATVAAIVGLRLYDPVLNNANYLTLGVSFSNQIITGAISELILACTAAGTGVMLYPYLRKYNESLGLGYLSFRLLEVVFILVGIVSVLALLSLSQMYTSTPAPDTATYAAMGGVLKAIHGWTFMLGPNFMLGINTFIYSYVFFKTDLVPRKLAAIGMVSAICIFIAAILELFGVIPQISAWGVLLAMPVFAFEMVLAFWLIRVGFNPESLPKKEQKVL